MKRKMLPRIFLFVAAVLALGSAAFAQQASGAINGTVTDTSGSVIPGASITLTNVATGVVTQSASNGSGFFTFVNLTPGRYVMTVGKANFRTAALAPFDLLVAQTLTQNVTLSVGAQSQTVTVNAGEQGILLERSSSELGNVIQSKEVQSLPLNGQNFTSLLILSPGVNPVSTAQGSSVGTQDAGISAIPGTGFFKPSFFGQQNRETFYLMDGIVNTDLRGATYGFLPIIGAVQEFRVQSHMDQAQFGLVTGGVINIQSKSGTNQFHGSVWEFVRNNIFDARNTFTDFCSTGRCAPGTPTNTPASPGHYTQNQFGGAVGGPIWKNKMFFYGAYAGWRFSQPTLSLTLNPTAEELSGDFSNIDTSFYQKQFYNPNSTVCSNGTCTVQPFKCDVSGNPVAPGPNGVQTGGSPCLKLPSTLVDPAMAAFIKAYYLTPNAPSNEAAGYNYVESRAHVDNNNSYQVRVDIHNSDRNFGFGRISQMWVSDVSPVTGTVESQVSDYHAYNFGGGYTHVFGPSLVLDLRGGAMLKPYAFNEAVAPGGFEAATKAGFQNLEQFNGMYINLAGPYNGHDAGNEGTSQRGNPVANFGADLTWIRGSHTVKGGASYLYQNRLQTNLFQQVTFSDATTSNLNAANTGNSLASALLGLPANFTLQNHEFSTINFSLSVWSAYLQDSWKVTPKLTLNYGLRYDYLPGIHMLTNDQMANGLDLFHQKYILQRSVPACTGAPTPSNPCIPGGIDSIPHHENIVSANGVQQVGAAIKDNIAPRFGFAYQVAKKTVVNGGFGILYDTVTARSQWVQNNLSATWPSPAGQSSNPVNFSQNGIWPGGAGNPLMTAISIVGSSPNPPVAATPWLQSYYVSQPGFKDSRSLQYNLQVQQQLSSTMLFSLAYAGSRNTRLPYTGYANAAQRPSPRGTPLSEIDSLKLTPWASPSYHYSIDTGRSNYNALLVSFQKRFSSSLNMIASYTWSKSLDDSSGWFGVENGAGGGSTVQNFFDQANAYGVSGYNVPSNFTWSTVYALPFGKGRRWVQSGPLSYLAGGWTANFIFMDRSGQPYGLNVNGDVANISGDNGTVSGYSRPNVVGNPTQGGCGGTPVGKRGPKGFCEYNPSAFAVPPTGSFGNLGRMPYQQPSVNNLDFSLVKELPIFESMNLELRAEAFNVYNVMIMGGPGTTIGNSSAGLVNGIANAPRELQFGAKIVF